MKSKKVLLAISTFTLGSFGLFSCSKKEDENTLTGGDQSKCIGISSYLYSYEEDGTFEPLPQHNAGDCTGKEETIYLFRVLPNVDYLLMISPILSGGSKLMVIVGDAVTISKNDNYEVTFYKDRNETSYNVKFLKEGNYHLDISFKEFTDQIDVEVVSNNSTRIS